MMDSTPALYFTRFPYIFVIFLWIHYFLMNYLNMAISHLQLVFKEEATGENNHKLNNLRMAPVLAEGPRSVPVSEPTLGSGFPGPLLF